MAVADLRPAPSSALQDPDGPHPERARSGLPFAARPSEPEVRPPPADRWSWSRTEAELHLRSRVSRARDGRALLLSLVLRTGGVVLPCPAALFPPTRRLSPPRAAVAAASVYARLSARAERKGWERTVEVVVYVLGPPNPAP